MWNRWRTGGVWSRKMIDPEVFSGTCSECGRPLVQIIDAKGTETYHLAAFYELADGRCPVLLVILGTEGWVNPAYSLSVPNHVFVLDESEKA